MLNLPEGIGLQKLEREILQLPLEAADAEPVGQRCVDLPGLAGDALLLLDLKAPSVRMLWRRSASFTSTTRMSLAIASSFAGSPPGLPFDC